ncbi:MAG: ribonuclease Z [Clostridia bacterium]|nr:ribonuclease Z [Clostridia bacterium]
MKLTFLGTSHGIPEKNRFCTCNMLEIGEDIYIFDVGAPLAELLTNRDVPYEKVKKLFITHCHLDHMNGLEMFLRLCKWHVTDSQAEGYLPDKRVVDKLNEPLQTVGQNNSNMHIKVRHYTEGVVYQDENLMVTAIPNKHLDTVGGYSFGFDVEVSGKHILFTGDLTHTMDDFPEIAFSKHYDLIVTECAHASVETLKEQLSRVKADMVVVNHIYPQSKIKEILALDGEYNFKLLVGNDNDEIKLEE